MNSLFKYIAEYGLLGAGSRHKFETRKRDTYAQVHLYTIFFVIQELYLLPILNATS